MMPVIMRYAYFINCNYFVKLTYFEFVLYLQQQSLQSSGFEGDGIRCLKTGCKQTRGETE